MTRGVYMPRIIKRTLLFFRHEIMLDIAIIAAIIGMCISPPTFSTIERLNWKTIFLLFMLFSVLEGFKKENMFDPLIKLASRIKHPFALIVFLTSIVFVLSAFITNDVALITFVPITIVILKTAERESLIIPTVVIETISANLGSLATPFGNPQNLYLYDKMNLTATRFLTMMLPLAAVCYLLIFLSLLFISRKSFQDELIIRYQKSDEEPNKALRMFYVCLFFMVLMTVLNLVPWFIMFLLLLIMLLIFDRKTLKRVDYPLLVVFFCFFLFSSSISSHPGVSRILTRFVSNNEFLSGLILSQVISNVPAAILLEPYATHPAALLYGVDIGGLGTIVASLASLISLRLFSKEYPDKKGRFMLEFTIWNLIFLLVIALPMYFIVKALF